MKIHGGKHIRVGKINFMCGYSTRRFAIGIEVSINNIDIDLGSVWIGADW